MTQDQQLLHSMGIAFDAPEPQQPQTIEEFREIACDSCRKLASAWEESDRNRRLFALATVIACAFFVAACIGWMKWWVR